MRENNHLSQTDVAKRIGVVRSAISGYEHGTNQPPLNVLVKLATIYGVTTDYILGLENRLSFSVSDLTTEETAIVEKMNQLLVELINTRHKDKE